MEDVPAALVERAVTPLLRMLRADDMRDRLFSPAEYLDIMQRFMAIRTLAEMRDLRARVMQAVRQFFADVPIDDRDVVRSALELHSRVCLLARWLSLLMCHIDRESRGSEALAYSVNMEFIRRISSHMPSMFAHTLEREREQQVIDATQRTLVTALQKMIVRTGSLDRNARWNDEPRTTKLAVYVERMESVYLAGATVWLEKQCAALDPLHMNRSHQEEQERCAAVMHASTLARLDQEWFARIVRPRMEPLLQASMSAIVRRADRGLARAVWNLARNAGSVDAMGLSFASTVTAHVAERVAAIIASHPSTKQQRACQSEVALEVVTMYGAALELVRDALDANVVVLNALQSCVGECVNRMVVFGEQIDYCIAIMLDKHMNSATAAAVIKATVPLVSVLASKDVFAEHYRRMLAVRMLKSRLFHDDKQFVSELKLHNGVQYVQKMEVMIADMQRSSEEEFAGPSHLPAVQVTVLSSGSWPSFRQFNMSRMPLELRTLENCYATWYKTKHQSRILSWSPVFSRVQIGINLPRFRGSAGMCMPQACIICEFNAEDRITFDSLRERFDLPVDILKKCLHAFVYSPKNLLLRVATHNAASQTIEESDAFRLNEAFASRELRFEQPCAPLETIVAGADLMEKNMMEQRKLQLEAATVRIMKARKRMNITELTQEVMGHIRHFAPTQRNIKQVIETLIERDYMERDGDDQSTIIYC